MTTAGIETVAALENRLSDFTSWGGDAWRRMVAEGLAAVGPLQGRRVLEIGGRYGEMAVFFALEGASVTSVDMEDQFGPGRNLAQQHGVTDRIEFVRYGGDPSALAAEAWDVVFTKSVIAVLRDSEGRYTRSGYQEFLPALRERIAPGGVVVLVENADGPPWVSLLRRLRRRAWAARAPYFTSAQVELCKTLFETVVLKRNAFPPIVTFVGRKRAT